jgi:hypothetical protein
VCELGHVVCMNLSFVHTSRRMADGAHMWMRCLCQYEAFGKRCARLQTDLQVLATELEQNLHPGAWGQNHAVTRRRSSMHTYMIRVHTYMIRMHAPQSVEVFTYVCLSTPGPMGKMPEGLAVLGADVISGRGT